MTEQKAQSKAAWSLWAWWALLAFTLVSMAVIQRQREGVIRWDIVWYYGYLPAYFIHHDLRLSFVDMNQADDVAHYNPTVLPNGAKIIKTTMGMAYCYAPAFACAYAYSCWQQGSPGNGFGYPYQLAMYLVGVLYAFVGLWYLRRWLLCYYPSTVVAWVLVAVYAGTNAFYYTYHEGAMSHIYNFCFLALLLWHSHQWHRRPQWWRAMIIGAVGGMLLLIRPINGLFAVVFLAYGTTDQATLSQLLQRYRQYGWHIALAGAVLVAVILPQLLYWHSVTASWIFYSYTNERFFFQHPRIIEGLLSYRKGWLVYTPIMALALWGIVQLFRQQHPQRYLVAMLLPCYLYVVFSWWCWWYGGGFGIRALIDVYPLLALPMAAWLHHALTASATKQQRWRGYLALALVAVLVALNQFQTYQYRKGIIHWDSMTRSAYWAVFGRTQKPANFEQLLNTPNNEKALKGEDT